MNSVSPLSQLVLAFRTGSLCSDGEACMNTVGTCRSGRCRQEVEKLEHLLHQAQRRASRSKKEYKRRLPTMKKKQLAARSRNISSKARVAALQSAQVTLILVTTQRQGQVSALRSDNGHLLAAFAKMHSENKMLRTKVATLEAQEAELVADQVAWRSRVDRLYSLNKALRTRVTTMKAETFAHRSRIANLSSANEELHAECDAFWEDVQDLRFELDSLRPAFAKMHSESKMLQTKVATLEAREAELVADQVTWGSRVDRLDSVNQALRTRVTTLQAETFAHHSRIANLYSENEQLCTERDAVWEDAQDLRCQLDSLRFAFLEMDSENRTLRTRVTKLESQEAGLVVDQIVLQSRLTKLNSAKDDLCVERDGSREDARPLGIRANGRGLKPQQWSTVQEGLKIDADSDDMMEHQDTSAQSHCLEDSRFLATDIRLEVPALQDALQETDTVQWEHEFLGEPQSSSCPALVRDTTPEAQHWRPSPDIATPEDQERSLAGYIYDVNTKISELGAEVVGTPLRCRGGRHLRKRAEVA
ncbi:hypothetical protein OBBRIDRAFT_840257 [Obba rivulosa]|uniref:Uncharacterized protein n=1 Tax=Obba rivulosa TaxID=1052685 RepID=A0A8E2AFV8_9APHY|nr:hypothetical protein OBBRIDRAFT_840257 [Obba rivulosa]